MMEFLNCVSHIARSPSSGWTSLMLIPITGNVFSLIHKLLFLFTPPSLIDACFQSLIEVIFTNVFLSPSFPMPSPTNYTTKK